MADALCIHVLPMLLAFRRSHPLIFSMPPAQGAATRQAGTAGVGALNSLCSSVPARRGGCPDVQPTLSREQARLVSAGPGLSSCVRCVRTL